MCVYVDYKYPVAHTLEICFIACRPEGDIWSAKSLPTGGNRSPSAGAGTAPATPPAAAAAPSTPGLEVPVAAAAGAEMVSGPDDPAPDAVAAAATVPLPW